jgi:adenylate cyclase
VAHGRVFVDRGIGDRSRGSADTRDVTATRRLAAILAADVAGYSRLMGADEEGTLNRLKAHRRELVDPKIGEHHGRIVKTTGDGMLVEFASVVDAVRCAVEIQRAMVDRNAETAEDKRITFRIGVNLGDVIADGDDIYGDGVNIAARLEALAEPGGICISRTVRDHIGKRLPYTFEDMGDQSVKNIAQPVRVYTLSAAAVASTPLVAALAQPGSALGGISPKRFLIAASLVAAIGIGIAVWWAWPKGNSTAVPVQAPVAASAPNPAAPEAKPAPRLSIVVLPFANLSNDPDQEYFADGITDDLTTDLSRISGSFVIARNTAFTYKGKPFDVKQIGRELGVRYVLEGSVRRAGEQVQVNAQLIDAQNGAHVWADRFDTDRRDLARAQNEITGRLAGTLHAELAAAAGNQIDQEGAVDPDARDLVMRGWAWLYRPVTPQTLQQAQQTFERALAMDPRSIGARTGLARVLLGNIGNGWSRSLQEDQARAEQLLNEALERDANSSIAHWAKGFLRRTQNRLAEARTEFETVIALDRNSVDAFRQLGVAEMFLGQPEAAIPTIETAIRLSPREPQVSTSYWVSGTCHLFLGHVKQAIDLLRKAAAANPQVFYNYLWLAGALGIGGELDEARVAIAEALKLKPEVNSLARIRARWPWGNAEYWALFEKTVETGLRRAGFPDQ